MWRKLSANVEEVICLCGGSYLLMWRKLSAYVEEVICLCGGSYLLMWRKLSANVEEVIYLCGGSYLLPNAYSSGLGHQLRLGWVGKFGQAN